MRLLAMGQQITAAIAVAMVLSVIRTVAEEVQPELIGVKQVPL